MAGMVIAAAVETCEHLCNCQLHIKIKLVTQRRITERKRKPFWVWLITVGCWHCMTTRSKLSPRKATSIGASDVFTSMKQKGSGASESSYLGGQEATSWDRQRLQTALTVLRTVPQLPRGTHRKFIVPEGVIKSWYQVLSV